MNLQTTNQIETGIRFGNLNDLPLEHLLACFKIFRPEPA